MGVFQYKALDRKGRKVKGIITAEGHSSARQRLRQDSIFPVDIREVKETPKGSSSWKFFSRFSGFNRINPIEVTVALRQLATLVSSGLPLVECLNALIEQTEQASLKTVLTQIRERVMEGSSLSQAMAAHPSIFSKIHVNLVKAGETGGVLDIILTRLADFSEGRLKLKKKIEAALAYPIFLVMISGIILVFLMSFVMPKVIGIFHGMELSLPWSTRALIEMTSLMKRYWWLFGLVAMGSLAGLAAWIRTQKGKAVWDKFRLWVPVLGKLHLTAVLARFTRTLSILLKSGIRLVDALEIARLSMGNTVMEEAVEDAIRLVKEGQDLATPLKKTGRFPALMVQLIRAGEMSGELEDMLSKAAEMYENDVESSIGSVTSIIEPMVILGMGLVVGFIVMAILLPIFDMTGGIR
ncbi:MAG TPA: type II secretion system protein GspF [Deltaproteobacteria bacterium]|nr:type II secretion system protein GspF [Deltaproteobacteria bacterium]